MKSHDSFLDGSGTERVGYPCCRMTVTRYRYELYLGREEEGGGGEVIRDNRKYSMLLFTC